MAVADAAAAAAAAGEMVNTSTSAKVAADINDERLRWLSKPAGSIITSEGGGAFLALADREFSGGNGGMGCGLIRVEV